MGYSVYPQSAAINGYSYTVAKQTTSSTNFTSTVSLTSGVYRVTAGPFFSGYVKDGGTFLPFATPLTMSTTTSSTVYIAGPSVTVSVTASLSVPYTDIQFSNISTLQGWRMMKDGKIGAAGTGGGVAISTDAITYTEYDAATLGTNSTMYMVESNTTGTTYVAVGGGTHISVSTNSGSTWTAVNANTSFTKYDVAFGVGESEPWVVVGSSGRIVSSTDGVTWTVRSSGSTGSIWSITHDGSRFHAVGTNGWYFWADTAATWNAQAISSLTWRAIGYSSSAPYPYVMAGAGNIAYATDPVSIGWNVVSTPWGTSTPYGLGYANGYWYTSTDRSVTSPYDSYLWHSTDGVTWSNLVLDTGPFNVGAPTWGVAAIGTTNYAPLRSSVSIDNTNYRRLYTFTTPNGYYLPEAISVNFEKLS